MSRAKRYKREVKEEVGIDIKNIEYVTSLATVHKDKNPSLVISCLADYVSGDVTLQKEESDEFAWAAPARGGKNRSDCKFNRICFLFLICYYICYYSNREELNEKNLRKLT